MRRGACTLAAIAALFFPAIAKADEFAPVDRQGPPLSVPQDKLDASLICSAGVAGATRAPVLLVPGTTTTPADEFSWTYEPALSAADIPWCAVTPPDRMMGDIQTAGEYIVSAIRSMHAASGQKVSLVGHSQGGMIGRFALRFWPDTRPMVDDLIGMAPSNHGTVDAEASCVPDCAPSIWQQRDNSEFIKALNSARETFSGVSYSSIYTHLDEVVVPNLDDTGSSSLRGEPGDSFNNIAIQDICPLATAEHLQIGTTDAVAYALVLDALTHAGPADESRVGSGPCLQLYMPGVNPATAATNILNTYSGVALTLSQFPHVPAEPALRCYTLLDGCGAGIVKNAGKATRAAKARCRKRKHRNKRAHTRASTAKEKRKACKKQRRRHRRHH